MKTKTTLQAKNFAAKMQTKKRGRPPKNPISQKNNFTTYSQFINIAEIAEFTKTLATADDVFTVEFTNVNDDPQILISFFLDEFRRLLNRLKKERPFIPYAGYRIIEHTEKNPQIGCFVNKTHIIVTAIGLRFITKVLDIVMRKNYRRSAMVEVFLARNINRRQLHTAKEKLCEMGIAEPNILKPYEKLPNFFRAETKCPSYLVYCIYRMISAETTDIQTAINMRIDDKCFNMHVEVHKGNRAKSIGVDYGVTGFRYRAKQCFGYLYNQQNSATYIRKRQEQNEAFEKEMQLNSFNRHKHTDAKIFARYDE